MPNLTPAEAIEIQHRLQAQITLEPRLTHINYIAGADVSLNRFSNTAYAGFIVLSYPQLKPVAHALAVAEINFPYIPGLLSFREIPVLKKAWELLPRRPDLVVLDGQGIAHPRRLGLASHFGLEFDIPTIGNAKNLLYGTFSIPAVTAGSSTAILDPKTGSELGFAVRTQTNRKPIIVSPGYAVSLEQAKAITLSCVRMYRIPEPTRLAHNLVNDFRTGTITETVKIYE